MKYGGRVIRHTQLSCVLKKEKGELQRERKESSQEKTKENENEKKAPAVK